MQLLLLQILPFGSRVYFVCSATTCTCGLYCCQRWCWGAVFTSNWTGKAICIGYKLCFDSSALHFGNQFYKRRQWKDSRKKRTDSNPVFSCLQPTTQVRFSLRLQDDSHLKWLETEDANEVLMFLWWPEGQCNSLFLLLFVLPLPSLY